MTGDAANKPRANKPRANKPRAKKLGLIALRIVGAFISLAALSVGVTLLVLRSNWGGERLRRQVVARVNQQIRGSLDIKRLSFGGDKLVVWDVALRDPKGQFVARIARAEVDFSVLPLLHKEIRVRAVQVESPTLAVVSDDDGSNLSRALAPRKKSPAKAFPPKKKTAKDGWVVRLDRFDLTQGDASTAVVKDDDSRSPKAHLASITIFASVRYATGNGNVDLTLRLSGQSELTPVGPLRLAAQVGLHEDVYRFDADGDLFGGTLKAHGIIDSQRLNNADGALALHIPRQDLAGYAWGPVRVDAEGHPTTAPKLDAQVAIPGFELSVKDRGADPLGLQGRLVLADLGLTGRAVQALSGGEMPALGGQGAIDFGIEKAKSAGVVGFDAQLRGAFEKLWSGETVIAKLTFNGQATRLSSRPESAAFELAIASVNAGTSHLRDVRLVAKLREQEFTVTFGVAEPTRVDLNLTGRFDDDRHGLALNQFGLGFLDSRWASEGISRLRFDDKELSLANFRLGCDGQLLTANGSRRGAQIAGHLAIFELRLGQLPTVLVEPALRLDGKLDVDIKAEGTTDTPTVVATLDLKQARYQGFAKIDAKVTARLHNDQVDANVGVEAPFLTANGELQVSTAPLEEGAPVDLKLDVKHLDIAQVLRNAAMKPLGSGRANLKLRLDGSADMPRLDLGVEAFDLAVNQPAKDAKDDKDGKVVGQPAKAATPVDLGHAHVHVAYADSVPQAELDFAAAHGGTLAVEAATRVDLSYPHIKRKLLLKKLPVRGKVVARDLDVAWVAAFNPQVEKLGGQVNADARLAGTLADPQVAGDVRWKNGEMVATTPTAKPPVAKRSASGR